MNRNPIIQIKGVKKIYNQGKPNEVRAVDNLSLIHI